MKDKGTVIVNNIIHRRADRQVRRFSVTMVSYRRACLIAMYLSRFTMAKWDSDAIPNTLKTIVAYSVLIQYVGLPITPIARSVVDKQASAMLDLVFNWFLVFTAIMISAFIAVVSGQVTMQMTVMKTSHP